MVDLDDLEQQAARGEPVDPAVLQELITELRSAQGALRTIARSVVQAVEFSGQVMTVERVPLVPPAMGNHLARVSFRPKRGQS